MTSEGLLVLKEGDALVQGDEIEGATILSTSEGYLVLRDRDVLVQVDEIEGAIILSTSEGLLVLRDGDVVLVQGEEIEGATACSQFSRQMRDCWCLKTGMWC